MGPVLAKYFKAKQSISLISVKDIFIDTYIRISLHKKKIPQSIWAHSYWFLLLVACLKNIIDTLETYIYIVHA